LRETVEAPPAGNQQWVPGWRRCVLVEEVVRDVDPLWYIRNPDNVGFLNRADHLDAHGGNWRNGTTGDLLDRGF
jgi:hypothetical protein